MNRRRVKGVFSNFSDKKNLQVDFDNLFIVLKKIHNLKFHEISTKNLG